MFIIRSQSKNYDWKYKHEKVIVFDSENEAGQYFDPFANWAIMLAMKMIFEDPNAINEVQTCLNQTNIIPLPSNYDKPTIKYSDIFR